MAAEFLDLGFEHSYDVEINPEFPPAGAWGIPDFRFGKRGRETLTIKVRPQHGGSWVASFAIENRGVINGVYACPDPQQLAVVTGWDAFLMQASDPTDSNELPIHPIRAVVRPAETGLLVVGSYTDAAAIDTAGLRWVTYRLFLDDLEFVEGPPGNISVQGRNGYFADDLVVLTLDPAAGRVIARSPKP